MRAGSPDGDRLDVALVQRGLVRSRTAAQSAVTEGRVRVDGVVVSRPAVWVADDAVLEVAGSAAWVGRGAVKLDAALDAFGIDVRDRRALDLGASTGGFTQVLLERGAAHVVALDVGHDQIVPELRADPRVTVVEGENARALTRERLADLAGTDLPSDVVVADLSFISLTLVLPAIGALADDGTDVVCLVKPQFEVGRTRVRGGLVPDAEDRASAVGTVLRSAAEAGLRTAGVIASPVVGTHGNREVLVHLHRARGSDPSEWTATIERAVRPDAGEVG